MPIRFTCPHCGVRTDVAEQYAGRSGPCAYCSRTITVPPATAAPADEAAPRSSRLVVRTVLVLGVLALVIACCGGLLAWLIPEVRSIRQADQKAQCAANLQRIAQAVFDYRIVYDTFPPPVITDDDGRPMHSWRVLILPFLGEMPLYERYNFDQPWDSPDNYPLVTNAMPQVYRCPADDLSDAAQTSYLMVVGPGTFSTVTGPLKAGEIPDGAVRTLMLVETVDSAIHWAEPRDFDADQMDLRINNPAGRGIRSLHPFGVNAVMADGSVRFLGDATSAEEVQAMTTIAGGEGLGPE